MEFKDSQTYKNLMTAMAGESMARNKYNWYASRAKKDGYEEIAEVFNKTADNEKEHAKLWYKLLHDGIGDTKTNLELAAAGENEEWTAMYKDFAEVARKEGYEDIAKTMEGVAAIEKTHEEEYRRLLELLVTGKTFTREGKVAWICRNCGHIHVGNEAPDLCPVCAHPKAYFEVKRDAK
ncbi:MAG: rubrerythrin family protein [Clostridia bacterium]|nr:rubrerythrin family protein [Clostridia bacterium]